MQIIVLIIDIGIGKFFHAKHNFFTSNIRREMKKMNKKHK